MVDVPNSYEERKWHQESLTFYSQILTVFMWGGFLRRNKSKRIRNAKMRKTGNEKKIDFDIIKKNYPS